MRNAASTPVSRPHRASDQVVAALGRRAETSGRRGGRQRISLARAARKARTVEDLEDGAGELGGADSRARAGRSSREGFCAQAGRTPRTHTGSADWDIAPTVI